MPCQKRTKYHCKQFTHDAGKDRCGKWINSLTKVLVNQNNGHISLLSGVIVTHKTVTVTNVIGEAY